MENENLVKVDEKVIEEKETPIEPEKKYSLVQDKQEEVSLININDKEIITKAVGSIKFRSDETKSLKEQAKDAVDLSATVSAIKDQKLVNEITEFKKEELKTGASASLKEEQVKHTEIEKQLQHARYGVYEGIADLIGLKKPLPKGMLNALMVILIPLLIVYYSVVGVVTGIINVTMDCVNAITERFATFAKPAKKVIIFVAFGAIVLAVLLVIKFFLNKYNVIDW